MANHDEQLNESLRYVRSLSDDCIYLDGYRCAEVGLEKQQAAGSYAHLVDASGTLPAVVLPAWSIAYRQFLQEDRLTKEQKKLKHYRLGFRQEGELIIVLFRPLFLPRLESGKIVGTLRAVYGKEVKFVVDLENESVVNVLYGK